MVLNHSFPYKKVWGFKDLEMHDLSMFLHEVDCLNITRLNDNEHIQCNTIPFMANINNQVMINEGLI